MTLTERHDLLEICRIRAEATKAALEETAKRRKTEFAAEVAAAYAWANEQVWREAHKAAEDACRTASQQIAQRCEALGIPSEYVPRSVEPCWGWGGQSGVSERRARLTRFAYDLIETRRSKAKRAIERASIEIQTRLIADGLELAQAPTLLDLMPTADQLIPPLSIRQAEAEEEWCTHTQLYGTETERDALFEAWQTDDQ
jgi:hypothetical protein